MRLSAAWFGLSLLVVSATSAQTKESDWDVTQPRGKTRQIDFTVSEGTWTQLDVSPDGQWIVFDLLSHIYRVPAAGGTAQALTQNSGIALNFQPRISPDGRSIAFISDRKGQNNLWIMDADGNNPRQVVDDQTATLRSPAWTADGQYVIAVKTVGFGGRWSPEQVAGYLRRTGALRISHETIYREPLARFALMSSSSRRMAGSPQCMT